MWVYLREKDGSTLRIPIPAGLFCNELTGPVILLLIRPWLEKYRFRVTYPQFCRLLRALREARKVLVNTPFVEVFTTDGDEIRVWF